MNSYTVGEQLFCDFHFGGKPKARCVEVIEEGYGNRSSPGKIKVQLTETRGAYKKGEVIELNPFQAVPLKQVLPPKQGQFFTRISTTYEWVKPKGKHD